MFILRVAVSSFAGCPLIFIVFFGLAACGRPRGRLAVRFFSHIWFVCAFPFRLLFASASASVGVVPFLPRQLLGRFLACSGGAGAISQPSFPHCSLFGALPTSRQRAQPSGSLSGCFLPFSILLGSSGSGKKFPITLSIVLNFLVH